MIKRLVGQFNIIGKAALSSLAPSLTRLALVMLGLILGLAWAYAGAPIKFRDAEPVHLADGYKDQWIKMTAVEFAASGDVDEATRQIIAGGVTPNMVEDLINENQGTPLASQLQALLPVATGVESQAKDQAEEIKTGFISNVVMGPLGCIVGTLLIGIILSLVLTFYFAIPVGKWAKPRARPSVPGVPATAVSAGSAHAAAVAEKRRMADQKTDFAAVGEAAPLTQHMSTYILGDDLYDDSFSIETASREESGEFLGEYGAGISETIGVGDPKKVTAIEAWLFDKNDIRTVTKVLMSEHAFNDQALRTKLAPKGEAVLVTPGGTTMLETQTLRVQIKVVDLEYGEGALPPNSFFERLTVELAAWPKEGAEGGGDQPPQPPDASTAFGDTAELLNY
jgi:hypothetical protein